MKLQTTRNFLGFLSIILLFIWSCIASALTPISAYQSSIISNTTSDTYLSSIDIFEYASPDDSPHIFLLFQDAGNMGTPAIGTPQIYTGTDAWSVITHDSTQTIWELKEATSLSASIWLDVNRQGVILREPAKLNVGSTLRLDYTTGQFSLNGSVSKPYQSSINILIQTESANRSLVETAFNANGNLSSAAAIPSIASATTTLPTVWVYAYGWPPQIPAPTPTPSINPFLIPGYGNLAGQVVYVAGPAALRPLIIGNLTRKDLLTYLLAAGSKVAQHIRNVELSTGPANAVQISKYLSLTKGVLRGGTGFSGPNAFQKAKNFLNSNPATKAAANEDWHHIVGQFADNVATYGEAAIHNTKNLFRLDRTIHTTIVTPNYSRVVTVNGVKWPSLRNFLYWNRTYEQQYDYGMRVYNAAVNGATRQAIQNIPF